MGKRFLVLAALAAVVAFSVPQLAFADDGAYRADALSPEAGRLASSEPAELPELAGSERLADVAAEGLGDLAEGAGIPAEGPSAQEALPAVVGGPSSREGGPVDGGGAPQAAEPGQVGQVGQVDQVDQAGQGAALAAQSLAAPLHAAAETSPAPSQSGGEGLSAGSAGSAATEVAEAPAVTYRAYESGAKKWQARKGAGKAAGKKAVQAVEITFDAGGYAGGIAYKVRVEGSGWSKGWKSSGEVAGKTGKGRKITGLKVKLTGEVAQAYDVIYRVRDQKAGWQGWTFNGRAAVAKAGLASYWVKLKKRGTAKKISEGTYCLTIASAPGIALEDPRSATAANAQMRSSAAKSKASQKFYVRSEGNGLLSLQVVASGLFLDGSGGKVVQLADSARAGQRWKAVWSNGVALVNAASGQVLSLAGGAAKKGAPATTAADGSGAAQRWMFAKAKLISNGYYRVKSRMGTYLDVAGGSYAVGANVDARSRNSTGAQVFRITGKSDGRYLVQNMRSFLVMGVKGASKAGKANVVQQRKTGAASQLWKAGLDRSGDIVFKNGKSGKVLEVAKSSGKSGANVRQGKASGAAGQRWRLVKAKRYSLSGDEALDRNVARVLRTHASLRSAYDWTVAHPYREGQRYYSGPRVLPDSRTAALASDFFKYGSGNCYRFAAAFSWLARGLDYKTKVISGWVQSRGGGRAPHGWVEVVQGGVTYVCDPDLQHELPSYNWFMRTYATSPTAYHNW